ncbi:MAG: hypothetical protein GWP27_09390 [Bacteroidetes bacterium]|nr:hypothetical protein [Bacteroidota bacterium]
MPRIILVLSLLLCQLFVTAQSTVSGLSKSIYVQGRFLHQPSSFRTVSDMSGGIEFQKKVSRLRLNFGLGLNYGNFESQRNLDEGVLYVSEFRGTRFDYLNHLNAEQINLEIPVSLEFDFIKLPGFYMGLETGVVAQLLMYSRTYGHTFTELKNVHTTVFTNPIKLSTDRGNLDHDGHYLINDVFGRIGLRSGFELSKKLGMNIGVGVERSLYGGSYGGYARVGLAF